MISDVLDQNLLIKTSQLSDVCLDLIREKFDHIQKNTEDPFSNKGLNLFSIKLILRALFLFYVGLTNIIVC